MWPDDGTPGPGDPTEDDVVVPFDPTALDRDLVGLDTELRRAGDRLRHAHARDGRERPAPAFASGLRARLLAEAAAPMATSPAAAPSVADATSYARPAGQVAPRVARRTPTILPAPRWTILAVAAALVVSVLGLNADRLFPAPAPARVGTAVGATLLRNGTVGELAAGTPLRPGDTVSVAAGGRADLVLGGGAVRLDGGSSLRIEALTGGVVLEQLAGRAWHRVAVPDGGTYAVTTGAIRWTALGTAFDLAWLPADGAARDRVRALTVEHDVRLDGPGLELRVPEGRAVIVDATGASPDVAMEPVGAAAAGDPWLLANARRDVREGFGVGWLTTALAAEPSMAPPVGTPEPVATSPSAPSTPAAPPTSSTAPAPTAAPVATPRATPPPTAPPAPTARPTAKPTPAPTPTPAPELGALSLSAVSCGGAVLLDWGGSPGTAFHHYTALRAPETFAVPAAYPPPGGVTALDASYATNVSATRFADTSLAAGSTAWYRAVAWDAEDRAIAASAAVKATGKPVASLGTFAAVPVAGGAEVSWVPYGGPGACFTYYKIAWSATSDNPSYLGDNDGALPIGEQGASGTTVALGPGTWWIRVEAILVSDFGKAVVGRSTVAQVTVP